MARQILFIDPLEKLVVEKDSSLMFALSLQELGHEVYLLFEKDFYFQNTGEASYHLYPISGSMNQDTFYIEEFKLEEPVQMKFEKGDVLHMRIDPPFDTRYLRYLWMLKAIEDYGVKIVNSVEGVLKYNEKLYAYQDESSIDSYVGSSETMLNTFLVNQKAKGVTSLILKPLDLYQGIGVEKRALDDKLLERFKEKVLEVGGPLVVQPFVESVSEGEIRSLFYKGIHLGSILKVPAKGEFLANIARGAKYHEIKLNDAQLKSCNKICSALMKEGVDWIAFDILEDAISEVNITCPGLLVEVSNAVGKNLAMEIAKLS